MKLVSLCPSITRLLFDLDLGDHLVAVTKFCIHPAEAVAKIEKIGGTKDPDLDRIHALAPDWVLLNREENRRPDGEWLAEKGLRIHVSHPCNVDETLAMIREFGTLFAREALAEAKCAAIEAARAALVAAGPGKNARFAYLIWRKPWMTVNGETYISNLLAESGAENVFADADTAYPAFEAAQLGSLRPDRVFLSSEPFPFKQKHVDELAEQSGLDRARFRLVDGELLSWHGAFTAEGLRLAGDLFTSSNGSG
ncbi:helical backbone metal receptor [Acanthopleuribacter pedis]|uniref:ABC transporter substrate-binding protein n=1 Tax=Acanthopleuribacter pedis TaxID=442870 RepID=A0A8J7U3W5_9BACT|nr:helical backbone metal receptor [Acanthopleuribacter pedis]MBO1320027.1 ABC transporter substrate-binding protein [Acanthopleuribacter pedis]